LSMDIDKILCMTVPEAAKLLRISRNHCYELVKRGVVPSIRLGKKIVIPRIALDKKLAEAK
jgi:excisionase family DNA binding protein